VAALALTGCRLTIARAAAPRTAHLLNALRSFFNVMPSVGGWALMLRVDVGGRMTSVDVRHMPKK
jgi:hypothetical protein